MATNPETKSGKKPLWIALVVGAILILIAYSFIFWNPATETEGQMIPRPTVAPQGEVP